MKLRNKKTGEIVILEGELLFDNKIVLLKQYNSLSELNEEWEDYPKEPLIKDEKIRKVIKEWAENIQSLYHFDKINFLQRCQLLHLSSYYRRRHCGHSRIRLNV